MIKSLRLTNFRCYEDSGQIKFAPLTILIGPNNGGKSTLFKSILALKQTMAEDNSELRFVTTGSLVNLGSFRSILRSGNSTSGSDFSIAMKIAMPEAFSASISNIAFGGRFLSDSLNATFGLDRTRNHINVPAVTLKKSNRITLATHDFGRKCKVPDSQTLLKHLKPNLNHFIPFLSPIGEATPLHDASDLIFQALIGTDLNTRMWSRFFAGIQHVGPIREHIPYFVVLGASTAMDRYTGGEGLLRAMSDRRQLPLEGRSLLTAMRKWLQQLAFVDSLQLQKIDNEGRFRVLMAKDHQGPANVNVAGMGEGVSQVMPIIGAVASMNEDSTLLVEQPEVHLHPRAQAELADLIVGAVSTRPRAQIIVETHSEHLLLRLRRRIKEGVISQKNVQILFVNKVAGESVVKELPLDRFGAFEDWPDGFFDEAYQEAVALATTKRDKVTRGTAVHG